MSIIYDRQGHSYFTKSIKEMNPGIFSWLELLDMNTVIIIIILMLIVSGVTMISGLLIILSTPTSLEYWKAMGARNGKIRRYFFILPHSSFSKGCLGQSDWYKFVPHSKQYGVVKLDPSTYYLSHVPIELNFWYILKHNVGTLIILMAMIVGPFLHDCPNFTSQVY